MEQNLSTQNQTQWIYWPEKYPYEESVGGFFLEKINRPEQPIREQLKPFSRIVCRFKFKEPNSANLYPNRPVYL